MNRTPTMLRAVLVGAYQEPLLRFWYCRHPWRDQFIAPSYSNYHCTKRRQEIAATSCRGEACLAFLNHLKKGTGDTCVAPTAVSEYSSIMAMRVLMMAR